MSNFTSALTIGETSVRQVGGLFSLNDLHKASGGELRHRPIEFIRLEQTQALIGELQKGGDPHLFLNTTKGRNGGTYACRELVIAYAAWISAAFHLKVIRVFLAVAAPQATPYTVQPSDTLSEAQQIALRAMLESNVKRLPMEKRGPALRQGWSKLKAHFKVPYRKIPASEFEEALSILTRHVVEWEVVDEAPKAETLNDTVADWVRKIEEPNGYPAILFMPLVNAVLRKMGFTLPGSELPRLALTMTPPPSRSYKYDRANPYPRNGRTIEVAKSIVADIRDWSDNLPAGPAKRDLYDATDTLYGLLVSGWTEVDEALGQLSTAMHYLNRWQGRGGRMGNIS